MSARQWKARLEECQQKLSETNIAALEWKKVAENRMTLIQRLDETLSHNLSDLVAVGEVFGVSVQLTDDVWTPTSGMEAGVIAMYIMGKLEAVAEYQRALLSEASTIQVTLHDTYSLACEAVTVARPSMDLTLPPETERVEEPSSPYREYEAAVNDIPPPKPKKHDSLQEVSLPRPHKQILSDASSALSLFKK